MVTARQHYTKQADEYDSYYEQPFYCVYAAIEIAFTRKYLSSKYNVIHDAAGATGLMSIPLAEEGHQVYLTDISPQMVAKAASKAHQKNLSNFYSVVANIESLPFEDAVFDLVMCLGNPLSYCNYEKALREFHRTMKEGAALVASIESRLFLAREAIQKMSLEKAAKAIDTGDVMSPFPMHGFTVPELSQVLETSGFIIDRIAALPLLIGYKPDSEIHAAIKDLDALEKLVEMELQYGEKREWLEAGKNILFCCIKSVMMLQLN